MIPATIHAMASDIGMANHTPFYTPELRQCQKQGDEEQQLPCQGQENALARLPDALEEVGRNHLHAD